MSHHHHKYAYANWTGVPYCQMVGVTVPTPAVNPYYHENKPYYHSNQQKLNQSVIRAGPQNPTIQTVQPNGVNDFSQKLN